MKSRSHRLPTISDTPDDWVDESWTVDCVCGVNFDDGEEMVDCDECGVWVHTRCSRYVKSEKLFSCDKCKSKKLRKESEETEVAQLLVELPTKTIRMDNPYPMSCPPQSSLQVWTEVPLEEKVHVQGIPGGDPSLFHGVSSVFSKELWKCTGYVPKKFNFQYKEFPCWDNRQDDDDDDDDKKEKEETENHACKGANALFSLSKENPPTTDMGPPTTDTKKQDVENKEKSLMKPIVIHSVNKKKDDSKVVKDLNKKKKEGDSKKRDLQTFESVSTTSSDAKQSGSYEGKGHKVSKTDKQSCKHENSRADDLQENHKSDGCIDNNTPIFSGKSPENTPRDASRPKQMEENDENQVPPSSVEISPQKDDVIASSLKPNPVETITMKNEATTSNGTQPNMENLEKVDITLNRVPNTSSSQPIEVKTIETNQIGNISNHQNDSKVDNSNSKNLGQDSRTCDEHLSEVKKETSSVSQIHKAQNVEKSQPHAEKSQPSQPHVEKSQPSQHHVEKSQPHGTVNQGKMISKPSVPDKARYFSTDKQKGENNNKSKKDNLFTELPRNGDLSEKPKKIVKDLHKSLSTSALKSSHLSKSSVSKKNSSDSKDPAILPSSKTATTTPDSGDSANSESSQKEKISQLNRQPPPVPKNHLPHVHPPPSSNSPATLSDEELALLLHQELNSSPRVPRVPRMRHAGSLPQLNSTPSTSTLMKRTLSSGGKDNLLVSRKRNKDLASNSRELDGGKKGERVPSLPNSRRQQEVMKNGSAKVIHHVDKNAPLGSTTVSSGPSSSNEANENNMSSPQNGSDDEGGLVGVPTHRTLPGLIAEIMSKGKRMAYEELCNAVLPHWPNLRKHNGERYAYSSHSQAVLDCLRNRSEWSRLVDRGPKTNAGRKRRKSEADPETIEEESEEEDEDYSTDNNKTVGEDYPKGKRKARKHRRLALQETRIKEVRRRRRKSEVVSDDNDSSSDSSEETAFSDEEGRTAVANEASGSSDEMDSSV